VLRWNQGAADFCCVEYKGPSPSKPMKGFVVIPAADVDDDARIGEWVERGLATARAMPAKR
jgi:hypothetical protein